MTPRLARADGQTAAATARRSYRSRTQLVFSALLLVVLVAVSLAFYRSNRSFLVDYIREMNATQAQSYARQLDAVFFRASYASAAIAERGRIQQYVTGAGATDASADSGVMELLQLFTRANREMTEIAVYSADSDRIVTNRAATPASAAHDCGWLPHLRTAPSTGPQLVYREDPVFGTPMITLVRRTDDDGRFAGGIVINLQMEGLRRFVGFRAADADRHLYAVQDDDRVVFSTDDADLGRPSPNSEERPFLASASGALFNLEYHLSSGSSLFDAKMGELRRYLAVLLVTTLVVGSALSAVLAGFAYRPIRAIMETLEHPDLHARDDGHKAAGDEVRYIEDSILRIMASNRDLEGRLADRFRSLSRAHYANLQLQINPHFLYNTLESLYWNSLEAFEIDDPVPTSLLSLSRFLRNVIAADAIAIPLAEEVDIADQYVRLLQLRYENQLEVVWQVPDELRSVKVPRLVLQPLLENAFYHGIKPLRRPGTVTVTASSADGMVTLEVADDGTGMDEGRLRTVRKSFTGEIDLAADHIGLMNVAQRLRILFDTQATVNMDSVAGHGTTVRLTIPDAVTKRDLDKLTYPM
ncbi:MAG: cache domain-containing sensor histidine kinase [Spirochaetota bacterium]